MTSKRVNMYLKTELLEVLDAFAKINNRNRTYVLHELLSPSIPVLKELIALSEGYDRLTDADQIRTLHSIEELKNKLEGVVGESVDD